MTTISRYGVKGKSGNKGHKGVPGQYGGSAPSGTTPEEAAAWREVQSRERATIFFKDYERLLAMSTKTGKVLFDAAGGKSSVHLSDDDIRKMVGQDAILTHNHPTGRGFSMEDIATTVHVNGKEIRAYGIDENGKEYLHICRRPEKGWPESPAVTYQTLHYIWDEVEREWWGKINSGKMTVSYANAYHSHECMKRYAARTGVIYERRRTHYARRTQKEQDTSAAGD